MIFLFHQHTYYFLSDISFILFNQRGGAFAEWDFLRGQEEGWIPNIPIPTLSSTDLYGTCYDIIFRTNDDASIIHEFPDPKSLDPNNWQGFSIDDDVVVTHGKSLKVDSSGNWYNPTKAYPEKHDSNGLKNGVIVGSGVLALIAIALILTMKPSSKKKGYTVLEK